MGDIARALGMGSEITFRGTTYPLAPFGVEIQGAFEIWLEKRAWAAYKRSAKSLPPEEHAQLRGETLQAIAGGAYSFGARASQIAINESAAGQKYLLYLLLKKAEQPDKPITEALVDEIHDADLQEAMAQINAQLLDPNSPTPATGRGSPSPVSAPPS